MKPIKRSKLRLWVGTRWFRARRYIKWYVGGTKFAYVKQAERLPIIIKDHRTPLLRKLQDVDMSMQINKMHNLKIAIKQLNGIVIRPGETFSYWKLIGKPTKSKGYVEGMVLFYGKFKTGIGGGLCQLSNLIYWITLHTPLVVVERHRHSYDVFPDANRTQPFGSGATCAYNYLDLQIYNPTEQPFQLSLQVTDEHLIGEWRANQPLAYHYEIYEKQHRIQQEYWGGYVRHNQIYRLIKNKQNEMIADEMITENHALMMYEPLLAEPKSQMSAK